MQDTPLPSGSNSKTLVMKFGGTSVGAPEAMAQAVQIVQQSRAAWPRVAVITSALSGVTNLLLEQSGRAAHGDLRQLDQAAQELRQRHAEILSALVSDLARQASARQDVDHLVNDFINLCQAIAVLGEATPRALDAVAGLGERMAVRVLTAALASAGLPAQFVEATQLIVTDDHFRPPIPTSKPPANAPARCCCRS